ncbi:MAG: ParB/RepB/Spo0J family partition protein [Ruminococcaceae bacterium]|nr:ParB/RepB/Spo0J family partition protein [Oscillospiraceae bacterium]
MAAKSQGLGKGLDAIFEDNFQTGSKNTSMLRISDIEPRPNQPRKVFEPEALAELADSIATHGLIQPVVVRENSKGFYSIIAGERRWRAAKMAGLTEVPVVILDIDDIKAAELALVENLQREDLNPIEEAMAFETLSKEYSMTQEEISKKIGRSRPAIANALRLLDLPDKVKELVANNELSTGHAKVLLSVKDEEKLIKAAETVIEKELTVRDTEKLAKKLNSEKTEEEKEENSNEVVIDYTKELERRMTARMGRRIAIKNKGKAKKIEIEYQDNEDLENLINLICGSNIFDE